MTHTIIWSAAATNSFRRLRAEHPDDARVIAKAVLSLAIRPYPANSRPLGSSGFHRPRVDRCRIVYGVDEGERSVRVTNVGLSLD